MHCTPPTEERAMPIHCGRAIYGMEEVKDALSNAGAFLHQLPEELERMNKQEDLEFTRRYGLLLISIKAMVSHLSEAEEFVMEGLIEEQKQEQKSKKPNFH
tara:strand:- start:2118 stop:2420 length:303 start_codon:yes stop_codon:yes gene_type:complete